MDSSTGRRRRQRGADQCAGEAARPRHGRRTKGASHSDSGKFTAARTVAALGAVLAEDLRDPDGVARPLLRRAAVRMVGSRRESLRRLGEGYLRRDAPTPEELSAGESPATTVTSLEPLRLLPPEPDREPTVETDESSIDAMRPEDDQPHPAGDAPV